MSQDRSKKIPYFTNMVRGIYEKLCSIQSTVSSQAVPQTPEEHFALFLLRYARQIFTHDNIEKNFNIAYEKGVFKKYNGPCNEKREDVEKYLRQLLWEDLLSLKKDKFISSERLDKIRSILYVLLENDDAEIQVSEEQYKELLFLKYCCNFASWNQLDTLTNEKLLIYIRTLKYAVKDTLLVAQVKQEVVNQFNRKPDIDFFRTRSPNYQSLSGYLEYVHYTFSVFFRIEDIGISYKIWERMRISKKIDNFNDRMWHSLCVRIYQAESYMMVNDIFIKVSQVTKERQIVTMMYYWYYGLFNGYYAKLLFNILHSSPSDEEKVLRRLLLWAHDEDKEVLKYLTKRYQAYCKEMSIPEHEQIDSFKSSRTYKLDEKEGMIPLVNQLTKPDKLSDEQIKCLTGKLVELGFINIDYRDHLSFLLGGKGPSSRDGLIHWKNSRASLVYFIRQLYGGENKIASGTWQIVASNFVVISSGKYRQFPESKSYANLHAESILKKDEGKCVMKQIDDCIFEVRSYTIKK